MSSGFMPRFGVFLATTTTTYNQVISVFQELEPAEPWEHLLDATEEGPVCYQTDIIYGRIMQPQGMSESCIHANIHVPIKALPEISQRLARELRPPYRAGNNGVWFIKSIHNITYK